MTAAGTITRVVVHPDGALVTRTGRFEVANGRVEIHRLPLLLDPTTVRAAVGGAPVRGLRVDLDVHGEDRGPKPKIHEEWVEARDRIHHLDASIATTTEVRGVLAGLVPGFSGHPELKVPAPKQWLGWLAAEQTLTERVAALDQHLRELARQKREAEEAFAIVTERARHESSEAWWRRWEPTRRVSLDIDGDDAVDVELSYRVLGASWSPAYTLDADGPLRTGRFAMRAVVVQVTGEDWSGVTLGLSSAPCERMIDVPELAALRLGARQPAPPAWRELPVGLDALFPLDLGQVTIATGSPLSGLLPQAAPGPIDEQEDEDTAFDDLDLELDEPEEKPEIPEPPPPPPPQELAHAPMRSKSALGGLGRAAMIPLAAAAAIATALPAAPSARAAPRPAPPSGGAPPARRRQEATRAPEPEEPEGIDVATHWLDYGQLRLQSWDAPAGVRGHLTPVGEVETLAEAGLPSEARERYTSRAAEVLSRALGVAPRPLPPHHVLPAPIGGSDVRIDAAGAVDIPSDGRSHSIAVQTWPVEIDVTYRSVPRHDPRAFRRVTASLDYPHPLLPGPVDVYVDGRLELTSPWTGSPGRGRLQLGLGAEDRIKVVRNVRYREESAGMFGGSRRLHTAIEVSVASSLGRPVRLEVLERVPVPLNGEATVEVVVATPPAKEYPGEPDGPILKGGRSQTVELPPGGQAQLTLAYAVTVGAKDELVGGDRRG